MADAASTVLLGSFQGLTLTAEETRFLQKEQPSGVTLFRRNIDETNYQSVKQLCQAANQYLGKSHPSMIFAIDQEGGRVSRIRPDTGFPNLGPALMLEGGGTSQEALRGIESYASDVGKALHALGINMNFAPVADILTEESNHAIGDRAFGRSAIDVTLRAGSFLRGLQSAGVMGCLKHFPGQGDATIDTHVGSAHIPLSLSELEERELIPFRTLCNEASGVMISHCIYPALDNKEASLSSVVMEKLLRQSLGFQGLIISDDMMMGAIANDEISWKESIVESVANGADLVLVCQDLGRWILALEAIRAYQSKSRSFRRRLEFSAEKVLACRRLIS